MPDSKTLWLFREQLAQHGLVEKLFNAFDQQLWYSGFIPKGGQIIDASLVNVPKMRIPPQRDRRFQTNVTDSRVFLGIGGHVGVEYARMRGSS